MKNALKNMQTTGWTNKFWTKGSKSFLKKKKNTQIVELNMGQEWPQNDLKMPQKRSKK